MKKRILLLALLGLLINPEFAFGMEKNNENPLEPFMAEDYPGVLIAIFSYLPSELLLKIRKECKSKKLLQVIDEASECTPLNVYIAKRNRPLSIGTDSTSFTIVKKYEYLNNFLQMIGTVPFFMHLHINILKEDTFKELVEYNINYEALSEILANANLQKKLKKLTVHNGFCFKKQMNSIAFNVNEL